MTKTAAAQTVSALDRAISANWYVVPAPTLEQRRADAIAAILRGIDIHRFARLADAEAFAATSPTVGHTR